MAALSDAHALSRSKAAQRSCARESASALSATPADAHTAARSARSGAWVSLHVSSVVRTCVVVAGFARRGEEHAGAPRFYNSQLAVSPEGLVLAVYDKHFLYVTDKTWATPGKSFRALELPGLGIKVGLGVCMDINPREFEAPYDAYELANYHKEAGVDLILFSSAWCNRHPDDPPEAAEAPNAAETIAYWVHRLVPLVAPRLPRVLGPRG
eukprot:PRCOL_00006319-RA